MSNFSLNTRFRFLPAMKERKSGFFLFGKVGRGKSMLMNLYYHNCNFHKKKRAHFNDFMQEAHNFLHEMQDVRDPISKFVLDLSSRYDLLCLDEIQVFDITDAMILARLFEGLFAKNIIVVITGNYAPDDLYKDGLQRASFLPAISLIKDKLNVIELLGVEDYRAQRSRSGNISKRFFFDESGAHKLNRLFQGKVKGREITDITLRVYDRNIEVMISCHDIAWFEFKELCARALWVADYEAISKKFKHIFIANIPCFNESNLNEMRRFTILIDALYERRNSCYFSMATEINYICDPKVASVDFERTVSRLREMSMRGER